jgi:hypothetical protein
MARADKPKLLHDPEKAASRAEPLAEIEDMIARLRHLRERERDSVIASAYRGAIDRLEALAYRIKVKPETRVVGLPIKGAVRPTPPDPPQRTLPLGPVSVIVKARSPKKRW